MMCVADHPGGISFNSSNPPELVPDYIREVPTNGERYGAACDFNNHPECCNNMGIYHRGDEHCHEELVLLMTDGQSGRGPCWKSCNGKNATRNGTGFCTDMDHYIDD
ncbi:MAG: hypothetical protein ACLFQV_00155 [Vulcanimicrobiota bacterium]